MTVVDDQAVPAVAPGREVAVLDGEAVVFDPARTVSALLNTSATLVLGMVDGERTVAEVVAAVAAAAELPVDVVGDDVRTVIGRLVAGGVLVLRR